MNCEVMTLQLAPLDMIGEPPNVDFKAAEICGLSAYLHDDNTEIEMYTRQTASLSRFSVLT